MSKKTVIRDQHFGIARKIVSNMTAESWETIPHAVISYEPEVTEFLKVMKDTLATTLHLSAKIHQKSFTVLNKEALKLQNNLKVTLQRLKNLSTGKV